MVFESSGRYNETVIHKFGVLMSFDWMEYLYLAQDLSGVSPTGKVTPEAKFRTAISRAYYAAFCQACDFLRDKEGLNIPSNNSHNWVRDQFCCSGDRAKIKVGGTLERLKDLRIKADYHKSWPVNIEAQGTTALRFANKIISKISSLST